MTSKRRENKNLLSFICFSFLINYFLQEMKAEIYIFIKNISIQTRF